jgi:hypothetical protein
VLAVEKARRLAVPTEPVLFLCYNSALNEHLNENHKHANVSYRSFHGLAREIAGLHLELDGAVNKFLEYLCDGIDLPYSHLVIDEAQDFERDWLELLRSQFRTGSFYVFFDPFQAVQSDRDTQWLDSIPCRLTVTRNCRNTNQIARLAYQSAGITFKSKLGVDGPKPILHPVDSAANAVQLVCGLIQASIAKDKIPLHDIAILTLEMLEDSDWKSENLGGVATSEKPKANHITITTVRKFKGLEAKRVIVVDVDFAKASEVQWRMLLYIACSRARQSVHIVTTTIESNLGAAVKTFADSAKRRPKWRAISRILGVNIGDKENA